MSKNMTRKGLAFGAGLALVSTGVAASPATAVVDDTAVSLLPSAGTQYVVDLGETFDLVSDQSVLARSGDGKLKFKVTDPDKEVLFDFDPNTNATDNGDVLAAIQDISASTAMQIAVDSDDKVTLKKASTFDDVAVGDIVKLTGVSTGVAGKLETPTNLSGTVTAAGSGEITFQSAEPIADEFTTAVDTTAGKLEEISTLELDARDIIVQGSLGGSGLAVPTRETDGSFVVDTNLDTGNQKALRLVSTSTDTHSVTVQAWVDENGNGEIEATEYASSVRTVTFKKSSDIGMTLNFPQPGVGDGTFSANISFDSDVNVAQLTTSRFEIAVGRSGRDGVIRDATAASAASSGAFTDGDDVRYVSDDNHLLIDASSSLPAVAYGANSDLSSNNAATLSVDGDADTFTITGNSDNSMLLYSVGDKITTAGTVQQAAGPAIADAEYEVISVDGQAITLSSTNNLADDPVDDIDNGSFAAIDEVTPGVTYASQILLDSALVGSPTFAGSNLSEADAVGKALPTRSQNVRLDSGDDWYARAEFTGPVSFTSEIESDGEAVGAGVEATVTITKTTLDGDTTITAGGKTLTDSSSPANISFPVVTNADGEVNFSVSSDTGKATDKIQVQVSQSGLDSTPQTLEWVALTTTAASLSMNDVVSTNTGTSNDFVNIAAGGSVSMSFEVSDEFGAALNDQDYRVRLDLKEREVGGSATTEYASVNLSNGTGSYSFTDTSETTGSYDVTGKLQYLQNDQTWADYGNYNTSLEVHVLNDTSAAGVSIVSTIDSAGTIPAVETVAGKTVDATLDANVARNNAPAYDSDEEYTISGVVTSAGGVSLPGANVTLSGENLLFKVGNLYTVGSVTVSADASGNYSGVEVRSNIAGEQTLTVTSGGAQNTKVLEFDAAADTAGTSVTIDAPDFVEPGSTVIVDILITDEFGNPINTDGTNTSADAGADFKVNYEGPGVALNEPTQTDEDGKARVAYFLGNNDTGVITVTVSYDANGDANYTDDDDIVVQKTITIGGGVGYPAGASMKAWTVNQGDGTAKVYIKFPTIDEKLRIGHQTGGSGSYETIYVKTLDSETHEDLTVNVEGSYIVRTIDLVDGTNRIRVTVGDSTEVQVRYNE